MQLSSNENAAQVAIKNFVLAHKLYKAVSAKERVKQLQTPISALYT